MDNRVTDLDELHRHQERALAVLARGTACIERGPDALLAADAEMRAELGTVLNGYQRFKHERIFDPAIASDDPERAMLARHMKVACISAGEVFRVHLMSWNPARIAAEWPDYTVAARLTTNQLHRHIRTEAEGIADLLTAYR